MAAALEQSETSLTRISAAKNNRPQSRIPSLTDSGIRDILKNQLRPKIIRMSG